MREPQPLSVLPRRERRRSVGLCVVILAWGVQAIVTQSLLLREALVLMSGSEFAWGVVLFAWLFGVAVGALVGGRLTRHVRADLGLVVVLLTLSAAACVELWVFRGARGWLGVEPGELLPLPTTTCVALLFVSPASALVGIAFPLACCVTRSFESQVGPDHVAVSSRFLLSLGSVYALESAGSLVGGGLFTFWAVEHLTPIETALSCWSITAAAAACWLAVGLPKRGAAVGLAVVAAVALTAAFVFGDTWHKRLVQRRWQAVAPGYDLCAETESKYQNLAIGRRQGQYSLYCDGRVTVDFPDPYTFAPLAHFWMCQHPAPRHVLLLGGGAEGLLSEMLRHPIEHIDYVETDPRQMQLVEPFLDDADRLAVEDPRVAVHHADPRYFVKTQTDRFDLVVARLPEPISAMRARLYTEEFYGELRRAMKARSVLCLTAAAMPGFLSAESTEYLASIRASLQTHFPNVIVGWGDPAHILAATDKGLVTTESTELARRYESRGVQPGMFDPEWFEGATDWLDADKLERRAAQLDAAQHVEISTDLHPILYMQRLVLWERATGAYRAERPGVIERLRSVTWTHVAAFILMIAGGTLLWSYASTRYRDRLSRAHIDTALDAQPRYAWLSTGTIILAIETTGFVTMALSIVWLFAFQNLYGYVYQRIGWIVALFMGGLVLGSGWCQVRYRRMDEATRRRGHLWPRLVAADVLLGLLALSVPFLLPALGELRTGAGNMALVEWCISGLVAITGVLGGATFALAGSLQVELTGRVGASAGVIDCADHAGACLGALLCGILLVPVFGTPVTAYLLAGVKLGSALLLTLAWQLARTSRPGLSR